MVEYNCLRRSLRPDIPLLRIIQTPTTNLDDDVMEIGSIGDVSPKKKKSKTSVKHAIIENRKKRPQ